MKFFITFLFIIAGLNGFSQTKIATVNEQEIFLQSNQQIANVELKTTTTFVTDILLYPNPVVNSRLNIEAINVEIFAYTIFNSSAEIVEIDNLSGRPDPTKLFVDAFGEGIYYIYFETSAGNITRRFAVIE